MTFKMQSCHHASRVSSQRKKLSSIVEQKDHFDLDGSSLDIPQLVATACFKKSASVDQLPQEVGNRIDQSVQFLREELAKGHSVYGVTTGFGGSADTTTTETKTLQVALLQMQTSAVLPTLPASQAKVFDGFASSPANTHATLTMPEEWVRGALLVRCNSLLRGHSAVRLSVVKALLNFLQNDVVPLIPLRGSISASGDLCPLSYIAGVLEGNPDIHVWVGPRSSREVISSDIALRRLGIEPIEFEPKEILGLINGTSVSAAVAGIAQHQTDNMIVLAQILTAMGVEALQGTVESFDSFIAEVRPHRGQREVAANVSAFLKNSLLARGQAESIHDGDLRQDRYALRTSSQWLGPYIEDLVLSREQVETELNSTTDNPLMDVASQKVHHGGNFQAVAMTSSTEKARLTLQMIGKLIFAQSSELLNVHMNNGLPPNLAADEPSLSYTFKGVDINMAAYMSELAFLANPVSSHVQCAEMANQALNSLALISARYTHTALEIISLMSSAYLYSLCQALDLRAMNAMFLQKAKPAMECLCHEAFPGLESEIDEALQQAIWVEIEKALTSTTIKDSSNRFTEVAHATYAPLVSIISELPPASLDLSHIKAFTESAAKRLLSIFTSNRETYMQAPDATPFLGLASKRMYNFVRKNLGVPFHRGLVDHPTKLNEHNYKLNLKTTGGQISIIHAALLDESLFNQAIDCVDEAFGGASNSNGNGVRVDSAISETGEGVWMNGWKSRVKSTKEFSHERNSIKGNSRS